MSFLVPTNSDDSFPPPKRKKFHDDKRNGQPKNKHEDILAIGYHCKLFRDDVMAQYIEDGKHLIPWMGDEALLIDRYDCRGHLYSQTEFVWSGSTVSPELSSEEEAIEQACDDERYLGLQKDVQDENYLEEEELKRFKAEYNPSTANYSNIGYVYNTSSYDGNKEYDPNDCFNADSDQGEEDDESETMHVSGIHETNKQQTDRQQKERHQAKRNLKPFRQDPKSASQGNELAGIYKKPEGLEIPDGVDLPDSQKSHSIIEKTALLISKHGTQMEIVLKAKQAGNPQFDFLNFGNWLNPYYKLILAKIKDGSYKVEAIPVQAQPKPETETKVPDSDSSESDSESSDDNEYIHPLLQAHLRPVKTKAEPTSTHAAVSDTQQRSTNAASSMSYKNILSQRPLPQNTYANAAAIYMARKYENSRQDTPSPQESNHDDDEDTSDQNWADNLEEDKSLSLIDAQNFAYLNQFPMEHAHLHPAYALTSLIPPPPPPGQGSENDVMDSQLSYRNSLPPPPPPPGCSDTEASTDNGFYASQQQQQQHIVPPPPDLKSVVDKLADYVSRNGEDFEDQVKLKKDPRFDFLKADNIYYPYYLYKKQHCILEVATMKAQKKKEEEEKASKPLSFALKTKKQTKAPVRKLKAVEVFKKSHEESDSDNEAEDPAKEFDGYRPNIVKKKEQVVQEPTMEEKAKETMEKAKMMIAEAQKRQKEVQQQQQQQHSLEGSIFDDHEINTDRQVQMERRRKAAAFIGMLKQTNTQSDSSSSSNEESGESSNESDESEEEVQPKRHFQEKKDL